MKRIARETRDTGEYGVLTFHGGLDVPFRGRGPFVGTTEFRPTGGRRTLLRRAMFQGRDADPTGSLFTERLDPFRGRDGISPNASEATLTFVRRSSAGIQR